MPKTRTQHDLKKYHFRIGNGDRMNRRRAAIRKLWAVRHPPPAGKDRDAQQRAKHNLGETRMDYRQPVVQQLPHDFAPQYSLHRDACDRDHAEPAEPAPAVVDPNQDRQRQGKNTKATRDHPVRVLEKRTSRQHPQGWKPRTKRFRPVWHRQRSIVGGDQRSSNKQQHRPSNHEDGEAVYPAMVDRCHSPSLAADYIPARPPRVRCQNLSAPLEFLAIPRGRLRHGRNRFNPDRV